MTAESKQDLRNCSLSGTSPCAQTPRFISLVMQTWSLVGKIDGDMSDSFGISVLGKILHNLHDTSTTVSGPRLDQSALRKYQSLEYLSNATYLS